MIANPFSVSTSCGCLVWSPSARLTPFRRSRRNVAGQEAVWRTETAGADAAAVCRVLFQGLPCRRCCHSGRWSGMAGHAPVAQPQLGPSGADQDCPALALDGQKAGWNGLLVGDISQPRGGPMLTGHASHQIGLDADIWLTPMPDRTLTEQEREDLSATSMLKGDSLYVDPDIWTPGQAAILKTAASYPAGRAHSCPSRHQEKTVRHCQGRPGLALQGPPLLGP